MGISEVMASFQNAWYTISGEGQPKYRCDENGVRLNNTIMAELAERTSNQYGMTYKSNPYIVPDKPTLAYA